MPTITLDDKPKTKNLRRSQMKEYAKIALVAIIAIAVAKKLPVIGAYV